MHGRIVPSRCEAGRSPSTRWQRLYADIAWHRRPTPAPYVRECRRILSPTPADRKIFHCFALRRDGTVVSVPQKPLGRPA